MRKINDMSIFSVSNESIGSPPVIEGGCNGIQTSFMSREELIKHFENQAKKFGRLDLKTMKVQRYVNGKWVYEE